MTIEEIAKRLDDCANEDCAECEYIGIPSYKVCRERMVSEMGAECRKIVEQMGDDGK